MSRIVYLTLEIDMKEDVDRQTVEAFIECTTAEMESAHDVEVLGNAFTIDDWEKRT